MNLSLIDPFKQADVPEAVEYYLVDPSGMKSSVAQFNRRGTLLAVGCGNGTISIWDFDTRRIVRTLYFHKQYITSIGWSRNGRKLLTSSYDGSLVLWDLPSAKIEKHLELESPIIFAQFHPRDKRYINITYFSNVCLIVQNKTDPLLLDFKSMKTKVLNYKTLEKEDERIITNTKGEASYASFNRKGLKIIIGDTASMITVIDYSSMKIEKTFKIANSSNLTIKQIEFSRNHRYMLVNSTDKILRLFSLENNYQLVREYQDSVNRMQWKKCCFSSNNEYILAGINHKSINTLFIWSVSGGLVKDLEGPKEGFNDAIWHPLRPLIVSISFTGIIYVWTAYFEENWSSFAPDFQELEENLEYVEKEDEFDIKEEDEPIEEEGVDENGQPKVKRIKRQKCQQEIDELNQKENDFVDIVSNDRLDDFSSDEEEDLFCFSVINDKHASNLQ
ncbi:hypothetical protein DICPUDRAFT_82100 [Dictyostelium purpureum]|uniref:Uncharacterized protein n=1 Tax=Dictyostelium purpureum TaxID=5786 RepID=F0ZVI4_DICPU|nr:uncharacterized protein DICPUDRAFT_82100 [Dictyostelium purpureum]EGC32041.1 hypothetical protein DICPUDRAFT_82100 [Dictyostelium purpureum]|eukprot:XP_003291427.1 hypothetical protein DICPUDRAFT_82100 [Dictyostelium purpureum]